MYTHTLITYILRRIQVIGVVIGVVYQRVNQTNHGSIKTWLKHEEPNSTNRRTRHRQEFVNQIPGSSPSEYSLTSKPLSQNSLQH